MSLSPSAADRSAALRRLATHVTDTDDIQRLTDAADAADRDGAANDQRPLARFLSRFALRAAPKARVGGLGKNA